MSGNSGNSDQGADDFAEFEAAGDVEVGSADGIESNVSEEEKPVKKSGGSGRPPREAKPAKVDEPTAEKPKGEDEGDEDEGDEDEGDEEIEAKPKRKPSERISELSKRLRQSERLRLADADRLEVLEKKLLPNGNSDVKYSTIGEAPNPNDAEKYPLGHLDDRYIEDKLEWLAESKATARADAVLQRQQEGERNAMLQQQHEILLDKVDDLSTRGTELYDDFQDAVVESGMRGDWRLDQPTFEAAHEADNGAQILYELSQDKKEAARVAGLTPYGQLKYVLDRDAEIGKGKQPRKIPGAGAPPATQTRGANSRTRISPTTDNLDDFEKAWVADAKGKG